MLFWTTIKASLKSLLASAMRSFLAMLGVIIGVAAVISMLALAAGAKKQIMDRVMAMGTNLLVVRPGQSGSHGVMSGTMQTLTLADAQAIVREVPGVRRIAPCVGGSVQLKYMSQNSRCRLTGTASTYLPVRDFSVAKGREFTEPETDAMARVAILGPVTVDTLFGVNDPIGQPVKMNGVNFTVVGVLKAKGDQGYFNPDDQVLIPYTTAMKQVLGVDYLGEVDVQVAEGADVNKVLADISALLRKRHRLQPGTPDDFNIRNQADMIETFNQMAVTFTVLLGGIGGISLLVGGIGIMNIMLVTVTERTREIGIRKAIGAKERSILLQFLAESMIISGLGGMIGVAGGIGLARLIEVLSTKYAPNPFITIVEVPSILLALSFSAVVGIFFGFYPALRASRLDPVEALRYE
jgi:putative ABC transport system permease protein